MRYFMRGKEKPVPDHVEFYLNELQLTGLMQAEQYGWGLSFIRREDIRNPIAVLDSPNGDHLAVLNEDGTISTEFELQLRQ